MKIKTFGLFLLLTVLGSGQLNANTTWVDSLEVYTMEKYMPPAKFRWTWQRASLLFPFTVRYDQVSAEGQDQYLKYVSKAIDKRYGKANGKSPNAVASGLGMAFLAIVTKDEKYIKASGKIYDDYLKVKRTDNGGISHKRSFKELWDDTIFMVGIFLQNMYKLTGDEKYIDELMLQINAHREKLSDPATGLWYHGWDGDDKKRCNFCGQSGWSNNPEKRSNEFWGRGNGWVVVTLAETVKTLPEGHPHRKTAEAYLKEMIVNLPDVQDRASGHWFQLPMRPEQKDNYIESSATAMFAYGILVALEEGVVKEEKYLKSIQAAYNGLRAHSIREAGNGYLTVKNVCKGTCIGDMEYYLNRKAQSEKPSGIGMFLLFGRAFEHSELRGLK